MQVVTVNFPVENRTELAEIHQLAGKYASGSMEEVYKWLKEKYEAPAELVKGDVGGNAKIEWNLYNEVMDYCTCQKCYSGFCSFDRDSWLAPLTEIRSRDKDGLSWTEGLGRLWHSYDGRRSHTPCDPVWQRAQRHFLSDDEAESACDQSQVMKPLIVRVGYIYKSVPSADQSKRRALYFKAEDSGHSAQLKKQTIMKNDYDMSVRHEAKLAKDQEETAKQQASQETVFDEIYISAELSGLETLLARSKVDKSTLQKELDALHEPRGETDRKGKVIQEPNNWQWQQYKTKRKGLQQQIRELSVKIETTVSSISRKQKDLARKQKEADSYGKWRTVKSKTSSQGLNRVLHSIESSK